MCGRIEEMLRSATAPGDCGRLLMCRARVRSNQWRTAAVYEDAREAMRQFERAGEGILSSTRELGCRARLPDG